MVLVAQGLGEARRSERRRVVGAAHALNRAPQYGVVAVADDLDVERVEALPAVVRFISDSCTDKTLFQIVQ